MQVFGRRNADTIHALLRPASKKAPRHEIAGRMEGQCRGCYGDFAAGSGLQRLD